MAEFFNRQWRLPNEENKNKQSNYSMDFNAGDYITVPTNNSFAFGTGGFTINVWVNFSSDTGQEIILEFTSGNYNLWKQSDETILFNKPSLSVQTTTALSLNTWYLITVLNTGSNTSIYINGSLDSPVTSDTSSYSASNLEFGKFRYGGYNYTNKIDAVSIFNYALSQNQINTLQGSSSTGIGNPMSLSPAPVAYYPLGDQDAFNGADYLVPNSSLKDYVFNFSGNKTVGLSQNLNLGSQSTISYWVKSTSSIGNYILNNGGNLINTGPYSTNEYYTFKPNNSAPAPNSAGMQNSNTNTYILSTNWVHWTVVRNGTGCELYANGQSIATATQANWSGYDTIVSGLGKNASGIVGDASNFLFWNTNLSSTEVETLYNYGSPIQTLASIPQSSNLKAWYKLDASEVYNNSTTEWEINQAQAYVQNSVFCPNVSGQNVTDYLQVSNYSGTTGKTAASWSFWYNASEANPQSGALSGSVAEFKRNINGQYAGMEFTLYTEVAGVNVTFSTMGTRLGGRYMDMPAAGNNAGIQGIGDWVNIVLVYDGNDPAPDLVNGGFAPQSGSIRAYANGAQGFLLGTLNQYNGVYPAEGTIRTGSLIFGGGNFATRHMSASLSNYATWDKALTQAEVNEIVNNGQPKDLSTHSASSNLISWWKLNNLTTGLVDTIGGYNASIVGSNSVVKPGSISQLNGTSSGMSTSNLVQSDLSFTSGYSPYALDFDVATQNKINFNYRLPTGDAPKSISVWVKAKTFSYTSIVSGGTAATGQYFGLWWVNASNGFYLVTYGGDASFGFTPLVDTWYHLVVSYAGSGNVNLYYNGILGNSTNIGVRNTGNANFNIGQGGGASSFNGAVSNLSAWDTALTSTQVTEIYNEGVPSNLNNHSAYSNLESWWQLGSNSSFNNTVWTVLDEKGTNDGVSSTNMSEVDIVNGVGYSSNGVSSGMSDNVVGDAPYSTSNSLSVNMDVLDRVTGISNATITTAGTGYTTGTNISTTGGTGSGCTVNITASGGITAVTINNSGLGYSVGEVLTVVKSGGSGGTITITSLNIPS